MRPRRRATWSPCARTAAKYALYSDWRPGTLEIAAAAASDSELYEYSTLGGRLELDNRRGASRHEEALHRLLIDEALPLELHAPLPSHLRGAQALGHSNFLQVSDTVQSQVSHDVARRLARASAQRSQRPGRGCAPASPTGSAARVPDAGCPVEGGGAVRRPRYGRAPCTRRPPAST